MAISFTIVCISFEVVHGTLGKERHRGKDSENRKAHLTCSEELQHINTLMQ